MRTLQVGSTDNLGRRFNGQDLHRRLLQRGVESRHLVWEKDGSDPLTSELACSPFRDHLQGVMQKVETRLSVQALLQPFSFGLPLDEKFHSADIVHYHLIHTGYFSLASLPLLSNLKPSVWTVHDPWAMTGHCIYPMECQRWQTGCGSCPYLVEQNVIEDRTALLWKMKRSVYSMSKVDVVVGSKWMLDMTAQSPLMENFRVHHIPFGIDLDAFSPGPSELKRQKLGVIPGNTVLFFRSTSNAYKGVEYIVEAISQLPEDSKITILTSESIGLLDQFLGKHQIIELGWVNDDESMADAYQAADIFLMPSIAEAFGFMAMEAMACGKPCIIFDGTALPDVTSSPRAAICVPPRDSLALCAAIVDLMENPAKRQQLGEEGRAIALERYDVNVHVDRLLALYQDVIEKRTRSSQELKVPV